MEKVIFVLFLLNINSSLFSQSFSRYGNADTIKIFAINKYRSQIDLVAKKTQEINLVPDSIEVRVNCKNYGEKIEAVSWFKNSRSFLKITFYLKKDKLVSVSVKEKSPLYDDLYRFSGFYFESDTIFYSDYYSTVRPCMLIPVDKSLSEIYGYNPNFSGESLIAYIKKLFFRITTVANIGIANSGAGRKNNQQQ